MKLINLIMFPKVESLSKIKPSAS